MDRKDLETRDQLKARLRYDMDTMEVPARLRPDAIVASLKTADDKPSGDNLIRLPQADRTSAVRRALAFAAMVALIVTGAFFYHGQSEHTFKRAGSGNYHLVKNAESEEELSRAVRDILEKDQTATETVRTEPASDKNVAETQPAANAKQGGESFGDLLDAGLRLLEGFIAIPSESSSAGSSAVNAADASSADIVKSSGNYLFVVTPGINPATGMATEQIKIISAAPADQMQIAATVTLSDGSAGNADEECFDLFVSGSRMIALLHRYSYTLTENAAVDNTVTVAVYFDITDPTSPVRLCTAEQEGRYVFSDLSGGKLRLVTCKSLNDLSAGEDGDLPRLTVDGNVFRPRAEDVCMAINDPEASYLFISESSLTSPFKPESVLAVLGCGSQVTAAEDAFYVTRLFAHPGAADADAVRTLTEIFKEKGD